MDDAAGIMHEQSESGKTAVLLKNNKKQQTKGKKGKSIQNFDF